MDLSSLILVASLVHTEIWAEPPQNILRETRVLALTLALVCSAVGLRVSTQPLCSGVSPKGTLCGNEPSCLQNYVSVF